MASNKKTEERRRGLLRNAVDYDYLDYYIPKKDGKPVRTAAAQAKRVQAMKIGWGILAAIVCAAAAWVFFENIPLCIITAIAGGIAFVPIRTRAVIAKRKKQLMLQFREFLESLSTSIGAGANINRALASAYRDLQLQFAPDADIVAETEILLVGMANGFRLEELLEDFADRSGVEDIRDFASVYAASAKQGGNIRNVILNTVKVIRDKVEVEMEIETMVSGQKIEQYAMLAMPVVFVAMLKSFGEGLVDLTSGPGTAGMIIALVLFIAAFFLSRVILNIKV